MLHTLSVKEFVISLKRSTGSAPLQQVRYHTTGSDIEGITLPIGASIDKTRSKLETTKQIEVSQFI